MPLLLMVGSGGDPVEVREGRAFSATADKVVANTITETTLLGTGVGSASLPAGALAAGRALLVRVQGYYSTAATAPTLTLKVKLGGVVLASVAVALPVSIVSKQFAAEILIVCRTAGATGAVMANGAFLAEGASATAHSLAGLTATAAATVNTTAALAVDLTATWSAASASNTITATLTKLDLCN